MSDEPEKPEPPPPITLKLTWSPSNGEFQIEGPPRAVAYQMIGIALEKLIIHALMEQLESERRRVIAH